MINRDKLKIGKNPKRYYFKCKTKPTENTARSQNKTKDTKKEESDRMANPKYIKTKPEDPTEKVVYSFRIERQKLQKLHKGAKNENKTTPELLNNWIEDLTKNKILTNDYLTEYPQGAYFKIPLNPQIKQEMTTDPENIDPTLNLLDFTEKNNEYGEPTLYHKHNKFIMFENNPLAETYKIDYPPNNCDIWQPKQFSFSMLEDPNKHHGIDAVIIPEAEYIADALYFIYSRYDAVNNKLELYLIDQLDALNFIKRTNNLSLINRVENLIFDLNKCETSEDLENLADKYNTGNIIKLSNTEPAEPVDDLEIVLIKEGDPDEKIALTPPELERLLNETLRENKRLVELAERQDKQINELENEAEKRIKELNDKIKTIEEFLKDNGF